MASKTRRKSFCPEKNPCKYCIDYQTVKKWKKACLMKPQPVPPIIRQCREEPLDWTPPPIENEEKEAWYEAKAFQDLHDTNGLLTQRAFTYLWYIRNSWNEAPNNHAFTTFLNKYSNLGRYWLLWRNAKTIQFTVFNEHERTEYLTALQEMKDDPKVVEFAGYEGLKRLYDDKKLPRAILKDVIKRRVLHLWNGME